MQTRNPDNIQGVDLSHFQSNIDMEKVNVPIVYLKATEGQHTVDPAFAALYKAAKVSGKKSGVYHFFHVGGNYAVAPQAEHFCNTLKGLLFDCKPAIDMEDGGYHGGVPRDVTAAVLEFAAKVTAQTGLPCVLYSNTAFIKEHFTADIRRLPIWVADYNGRAVPADNGIYDSWVGYQYSEKGEMGGCQVDLDEFTQEIFLSATAIPSVPANPSASAITDYSVWPGAGRLVMGAKNPWVTYMGQRLITHGFGTHYEHGAGPEFTAADRANYREFQIALGYTGAAADGIPGAQSWARLVSGSKIISAFPGAEFFKQGVISAFTPIAETALIKAGCNCFKSTGNPWGSGDVNSYKAFQRKIGDKSADGVPGPWGWAQLQRYM